MARGVIGLIDSRIFVQTTVKSCHNIVCFVSAAIGWHFFLYLFFRKVLHIKRFVYICQTNAQTNNTVMSKLHLDYETTSATVEIEAQYRLNVISEIHEDGSSSLSIKIKIAALTVIRAYDDNENKLTEQEVNSLMFKHQHVIMNLAQMQIMEGRFK